MSQALLQEIYNEVTQKPNYGIAVKNNETNTWVLHFTTLAKMKANNQNSVDACFKAIEEKGYKDITVYLKRKCGSSSVYCKNKEVRLVIPNKTGRDVSTNEQDAFSGNSENAPALVKIPAQNIPTMFPNEANGLLGGMNGMQMVDMYSKSNQYETVSQELQTVKAELETVKAENKRLEFENFKLDSKLEQKNGEKKTFFSDEMGAMLLSSAPKIAAMFSPTPAGLNAAAQQPKETFSEVKTQLLNFIKNDAFTDEYCHLITAVLNKAVSDTDVLAQLQELTQPKQD